MTELPERILSGVAGEWEQALLESATLDAPSAEFKRKFSRRLSVALGTAGVLTVSGTSQAAAGVTWLKWLAIGFVVGTAGTGAGVQLSDWTQRAAASVTSSEKTPNRHALPTRTTPEPEAPLAASAPPSIEPMMPLEPAKGTNAPPLPLPAFAQPLPSSTISKHEIAPSPAAAPALGAEMVALESIREALSRGDARSALRKLDSYDSAYPSGALSVESRVLRIEALAAAGESSAAVALARRFLAERPDSPYAKRVQSLALAESGLNP